VPEETALSESRPAQPARPSRRATGLLLAGAATGLALASFGLVEPRHADPDLPAEVAARVGERVIRRVDYERVLAGVESDLRGSVDEAMRRRVLERMIDEELLVQRALDLGLAAVDRRVRGELTSSLIDSIVSEADAEEPTAEEVARHYERNLDFFTRPGRLRVRTLYFAPRTAGRDVGRGAMGAEVARAQDPLERARTAAARLSAGEPWPAVEQALADPQISPPPDVLLPPAKVRDYVGPTLLEVATGLEVGVWSEPIETGGGVRLVRVEEREAPSAPPLAEIEDLVRQDLVRRRGDEALRDYLDTLRAETPIEIDESIFAGLESPPADPPAME